jgi:ABC-type phosphate/phosphonate transport system substrate-binding protein
MAAPEASGYCFALPPSLGKESIRALALTVAEVLYNAGFTTVTPYKSYAELEAALLDGTAHAGWGPPIVCGRIENAGGRVAMRAVRYGWVTYRSVLLCRAGDHIELDRLGSPGYRQVRAAWVDPWSMAGYVLPREHLRSKGAALETAFSSEQMLGSYKDCFDAVLDARADITAGYAGRRGQGHIELCGDRAPELRTIAYTDETPNDGVVLSPHLSERDANSLCNVLRGLRGDPSAMDVLGQAFDVDGFDDPPDGTYGALLSRVG